MTKPPKPPKNSAPKSEHKRFAAEVLDYDPYKHEPPGGMKPSDDVPTSEHKQHEPGDPD